MSTTSDNTIYGYLINSTEMGNANTDISFQVSQSGGLPSGWSDTEAINLMNAIASALTSAGMTNVSKSLFKDVSSNTIYQSTGGTLS